MFKTLTGALLCHTGNHHAVLSGASSKYRMGCRRGDKEIIRSKLTIRSPYRKHSHSMYDVLEIRELF